MTQSPPPPARRPSYAQVFRHRNYRLFFAGQLLSLMGSWMQTIGQAWLVYKLTGSPLALGLIGFLQQGPIFFFSVLGGTIADRVDRRKLIVVTQAAFLLQAVTLAALAFTGTVELWHVAALALFFGLMNAIDVPTRQSFTVELVGREDLQSAIALNAIMFNLARVVGPAVAGVTIAAAGRQRPLQDLVEGFRYVVAHREIRTALLALAVSSFAGGPYLTMMPVFAQEVLGAGADGYGVLMTTVGAGALCGALVMGRLRADILAQAPSAAAVGFGLFLVAFSFTSSFPLAVVLILPTAFCLMLQGSATNIIVQMKFEDRMRGRVMAYYTMSFLGMMPFGALAAGAVADRIGVPLTLTCGGIVCTLGGMLALWLRRRPSA